MTNTPNNITELNPNEIIVVGTNRLGAHGGGLAAYAKENFGLEDGISEGLSGRCYAFPTLDQEMGKVSQPDLVNQVDRLYSTARALPEKTFYLTKVGCGIAGFGEDFMALFFTDSPDNIVKPKDW